jgi:hypothetical protein
MGLQIALGGANLALRDQSPIVGPLHRSDYTLVNATQQ